MAETPSNMVPLGALAAPFRLPDPDGRMVGLDDFAAASALLVMFICNHCPFVKHISAGLAEFVREYQPRGLAAVAINSNDFDAYPEDRPEKMAEEVRVAGYTFPYLYDQTQEVARAYGASCTPDFFLYDGQRHLVYRGQFDESRPGRNVAVTGADLRAAVDRVLAGDVPASEQRASIGCNIKWKRGNEPDSFNA